MSDCPYATKAAEIDKSDDSLEGLSSVRESSTIPKSSTGKEFWIYPSERMFYQSLQHKKMPTDKEDIEMLLSIHNFLNEGVWTEIRRWETLLNTNYDCLSLKRFIGRPSEPTVKARILSLLRISPRPFDRHDWYVDRCGKEAKYVIDYYGCPEDSSDGGGTTAAFKVDVRPAINSFVSLKQRIISLFWSSK